MAFAFPNYNLPWLGWICLFFLIVISIDERPRIAAFYGWVSGFIFYPASLPWIYEVMRQYGNLTVLQAAGVLGLMAVAGGFFPAAFAWCIARFARESAGRACFFAPFFWVVLEFIRTHLPIIGFPWNLLGYAASSSLALLQIVPATGIYGLTFLVAGFNALLAWGVVAAGKRARVAAVVAIVLLVFTLAVGAKLVPIAEAHHVAHLVQTDFPPQSQQYPADWLQTHAADLDELELLSVSAARREPGLIVWPEVPAPFTLQDPNFSARAQRIAQEAGTDFLLGVVDWRRRPGGQFQATNSAVLLGPAGQRLFTYDKIHLVPYGEYVPLRKWITFAGRLTADISDFTPGTSYRAGSLPAGSFGVFICYEAIFPDEIRRFERAGAELLINISNDGWFGRSAAPAQHLMMARVRAVELRRWMLRDTNNGFTVSEDPYGRIVAEMRTDVRGELDAPYDFRTDSTIYARFGDWLAWLSLAVSAGMLLELFLVGARQARVSESSSKSGKIRT